FSRLLLRSLAVLVGLVLLASLVLFFLDPTRQALGQPVHAEAYPALPDAQQMNLLQQSPEQAWSKNAGCAHCHRDHPDQHRWPTLRLVRCDCHGGNPQTIIKEQAHVAPRFPEAWPCSANPVRSYTLLNHESPEFVRFVNPGDLRVAHLSCGTASCH